jgi:amino acid transporter
MSSYSLFDGISIGIGGMIGGGIFLLNGVSVFENGKYAPLAWFVGMIVALIISQSYIILTNEYPDDAGTILYPFKLLEDPRIKNVISFFIVLGYIILASVYSTSMSSYVTNYLNIPSMKNLLAIAILIGSQIINYFPENILTKLINSLSLVKYIILLGLIGYGIYLPTSNKSGGGKVKINKDLKNISFASVILFGLKIFLSYEGFEMISNLSGGMKNTKTNTPISFVIAILLSGLVYSGISFVTNKHIGNKLGHHNKLSSMLDLVNEYGLGKIGTLIIVFLAIVANISAINATFFTNNFIIKYVFNNSNIPKNIKKIIGKNIPLPLFKEPRRLYLWLATFVSIVLLFLPDIVITNLGSLSFLLIFGIVCYLSFKLVSKKQIKEEKIKIMGININYNVSKSLSITGIIICLVGIILLGFDIKKEFSA